MIERLWQVLVELKEYLAANFDPVRDTIDIVVVTLGIYWLLLLIRGTRAVQILVGLMVLFAASLAAEIFQLVTVRLILENFLASAVIIIVVIFQHDIRRALAQVGRGFFTAVRAHEESQIVEEVVRAAQTLAKRRLGALIVLERESSLGDQIEAGMDLDATVKQELLTSIFLPQSPLHDGAVVIQEGRIAKAGCILPLTLRSDLPEGLGTRHRAGLGLSEETDAVVVVVSEETASSSVVMGGDIVSGLDPPRLRVLLREVMSGERRELPGAADSVRTAEPDPGTSAEEAAPAHARTAG